MSADEQPADDAWRQWVGGAPGSYVEPLPPPAASATIDDTPAPQSPGDGTEAEADLLDVYTDQIIDNTTAASNLMMAEGAMIAYGDAGLAAADAVSFNSAAYD